MPVYKMAGGDVPSNAQMARIKNIAKIANYALTAVVMLALVVGIAVWIWEEFSSRTLYLHQDFLKDDSKFRESRIILLVAYLMTLAFLCMIQCCIQIGKDEHNEHVRPRIMIWILAGSLTVLVFVSCAALASTYKDNNLPKLKENMTKLLQETDYYNDFDDGNFSTIGTLFNNAQTELKCCGVNGPEDYNGNRTFSQYPIPAPYSCCEPNSDSQANAGSDVIPEVCQDDQRYSRGCYELLYNPAEQMCTEIKVIGSIGAGLALILTTVRLTLGCFYQKMKKRKHYDEVMSIKEEKQAKNGEAGPANSQVDTVL